MRQRIPIVILITALIVVSATFLIAKNTTKTRIIKIYAVNKIENNNFSCDETQLIALNREIVLDNTPIQSAIKELLKGDLTEEEKALGHTTEFPNADFKLKSADLKNGKLVLDFTSVPGFTTGGSCRVNLIATQIIQTAKQFPEVTEVEFKTPYLFQP